MLEIDYIGEGATDAAIARRLIRAAGAAPGTSYLRPASGTGRNRVQQKLKGLNRGAHYGLPLLALLDLDDDPCPAGLVAALLPDKSPRMLLRVSVRSAEAWLMADREAYARHLQVPIRLVPAAPEIHRDLKSRVIGWAAEGRYARLFRQFQERRARGLMDWQILGVIQSEFIVSTWNPVRAAHAQRSPSLSRALVRLRELVEREAA